jgi:RNA polymerase-binding transcription factor DksA
MDDTQARERIDQERRRIETLIAEREVEGLGEAEAEGISELSSHDQHQADLGTETFEREKDFSLLEQLEAELNDLDHALRKLDDGTYGRCEACGKEIPTERLDALPGARLCVEDQARRG